MNFFCVAIKTNQNQVVVVSYFTDKGKRNQYLRCAKDRYTGKIFYSCEFEGKFVIELTPTKSEVKYGKQTDR